MTSEQGAEVAGVAGRLDALRNSMAADPSGAAEAAWSWIVALSEKSKTDAAVADSDLNELFRLGTAPTDLDGPTEGILVMTTSGDNYSKIGYFALRTPR